MVYYTLLQQVQFQELEDTALHVKQQDVHNISNV